MIKDVGNHKPEDPAHGTSAGRNAPGSAARNLSKWPFFSASQLHDSRLGVPEDSLQPRRCHEAGNRQKFPQTATCFHAQHLDPVSMHDTTSSVLNNPESARHPVAERNDRELELDRIGARSAVYNAISSRSGTIRRTTARIDSKMKAQKRRSRRVNDPL